MARIEVRVDDELKAKAEEACAYLGCTLSSIIHHQLRSTIDQYYKYRKISDEAHIRHCQGLIAQSALEVLQQVVELKNAKGANLAIRPEVEKLLFTWGEE
jgi:regulator of sigma D